MFCAPAVNTVTTFGPNRFVPRAAVTGLAKALIDDPLLDAFDYRPARWERRLHVFKS